MVSVTHLILKFTIVQNKFQQANKTKINHINANHIKFEVSLHLSGIWPTVRWCTNQSLLVGQNLNSCSINGWKRKSVRGEKTRSTVFGKGRA